MCNLIASVVLSHLLLPNYRQFCLLKINTEVCFPLTSSTSELFNDKSNTHEFVNLVKELALPGELTQNRSYDFEFMQVEKPYESYIGANVRLRFVTVKPSLLPCRNLIISNSTALPASPFWISNQACNSQ